MSGKMSQASREQNIGFLNERIEKRQSIGTTFKSWIGGESDSRKLDIKEAQAVRGQLLQDTGSAGAQGIRDIVSSFSAIVDNAKSQEGEIVVKVEAEKGTKASATQTKGKGMKLQATGG